jgi:hypothetical protein
MWWAIQAINPNHAVFMAGTYGIIWYFAGFVALTLALFLIAGTRAARRLGEANLTAGVLVWWAALAVPISAGLPSLSAILVRPLIAAVMLLGWNVMRPQPYGWARAIALALAAFPALLLVTPFIYILLPLTDKISAMRGLPLLGVPILSVALVCGILLPQLLFIRPTEQRRVWMLPAVFFAGGIILIASGWINSGFSPTQPRPDYLAYALDADTDQAYWVSVPQQLDGWTQQFFPDGAPVESINFTPSPDYFPNRRFAALRTPAPIVEIPPPELSVIDDHLSAVSRVLRLRALSPREANTLELRLQSTSPILQASIDEHSIDVTKALSGSHQTLRLVLEAPQLDGFNIDLVLQGSGGVHVTLTDYSNGLPPQIPVALRPADTMPAVFDFADPTIVSRSMAIPPAADTVVSEPLP